MLISKATIPKTAQDHGEESWSLSVSIILEQKSKDSFESSTKPSNS